MLRIRLLSTPPPIAIDGEPLAVDHDDWSRVSAAGFELVPAWQAHPARGRRRALAMLPALAVAAAVVLSVGPGHGATPMRARPLKAAAPAQPALVVQASSALATDGSRAKR
jgi:hypothetical protein